MDKVDIDEELHEMFDEEPRRKIFDSKTISEPLQRLGLARPITVRVGTSAADALRIMRENRIGCVLVVREGVLAGIFTERDLLMKLTEKNKLADVRIEEVMTPEPETLQPDDRIAFALHMMAVGGYRHVPIVDKENRPVGIVSVKDIVEFIVETFPDEILNLPRSPVRKASEREGA